MVLRRILHGALRGAAAGESARELTRCMGYGKAHKEEGMERDWWDARPGAAKRRDGTWLAHLGMPSDRREAHIL